MSNNEVIKAINKEHSFALLEKLNLAYQIDSAKDLFKILSRNNNTPNLNSLGKLKTKLDKDLDTLAKDLLSLVNEDR